MEQNSDTLKNNIEALLFFYNEPVSFKQLSKLLGVDIDIITSKIEQLATDYNDRGLQVIISEKEAQIVARIEDDKLIEKLDTSAQEVAFTPAVIETLAVIAYLGSTTETEIDKVRGVKSSRTVRKLLRRGYIEDQNNKLNLSAEALRQLGIKSTKELEGSDSIKLKLHSLIKHSDE